MKRKLMVLVLAVFALAALTPAAFAAVESGGVEYLWYVDGNVKISADGGLSYAELPGLAEEAARTGLAYDVALYPMADGGIRVEARDEWSTQRAYQREYPAAELAQFLAAAQPNPKRVLCTNGQATVAEGYVYDRSNGDWTVPNQYGWAEHKGWTQLFYSLDGVTWTPAEVPEDAYVSGDTAWWDGTAFYEGLNLTSADGIHWTITAEEFGASPDLALSTDLGKYRFEYDQETREVYLMDRTSADTGVLLPHMGQAIRGGMEEQIYLMENRRPGSIRAWYGPNDTVFLAVYPLTGEESLALICYPISSLDWCLENLKTQFRTIEPMVSDGDMTLGMVEWNYRWGLHDWSESRMAYDDGTGWKWAENVPWGKVATPLFCEGGYFWAKGDGHHLYRSADGRTWLPSDAIRPADQTTGNESYLKYRIVGTGNGFIANRHGGTARYGMFGSSGGDWCEGYSKAYLLDKDFNLVTSYDFGRLVETVGFLDGAYYAQVANSDGSRDGFPGDPGVFNAGLGSTIYRSTDGKNWTALPSIYTTLDNVMVSEVGGWDHGWPTVYMEGVELCSVAQLDRWRFVLSKDNRVYLMKNNAAAWVELPDLGNAIAAAEDFEPGQLTAAYKEDGTVDVTVWEKSYRRSDDTRRVSIAYPTSSLDWVKENLGESRFMRIVPEDVHSLPNGTDVAVFELANGEKELVYRNADTNGEYMYYESAPWGGNLRLLPENGKSLMLYARGSLWLTSDGVNWRKSDSEWVNQRMDNNIFPYSFVWTGDKYLVGNDPFGGWGKGAGYELNDLGKAFLLDENLNPIGEHDFTEYAEESSRRRNVKKVGFADGVCYVQLSDLVFIDTQLPYGTRTETKTEQPVVFRSADGGVTWEKTDIYQVRAALK